MLLSHFVSSIPHTDFTTLKSTGKTYLGVRFDTRVYPVFNQLYSLFFVNGRKTITNELFHYMSPQALAYWIMSDGAHSEGGLILCTDCFTVQEVVVLINILIIRYELQCTIQSAAGMSRIYISRHSMASLRSIVGPHMLPFSNYKLNGLRRSS